VSRIPAFELKLYHQHSRVLHLLSILQIWTSSLYNHVSHFLKWTTLYIYIFNSFCFSGDPWIIHKPNQFVNEAHMLSFPNCLVHLIWFYINLFK
jgi:hypothetical protein